MEVKEAVQLAKRFIIDMFGDEQISNVGLEEVDFDSKNKVWYVTIGFSRPWDVGLPIVKPNRSYKVVRIKDAGGDVLSVKDREIPS